MPNNTDTSEAVDEVTQTNSEVAQNNVAHAQRALSTTRAYLSDTLALNPKLLTGGATDMEAMFKAGFGLQNAVLAAMTPLLDASFGASKSVFEAYTRMVERQQEIVLGTWKRAVETAQQQQQPAPPTK